MGHKKQHQDRDRNKAYIPKILENLQYTLTPIEGDYTKFLIMKGEDNLALGFLQDTHKGYKINITYSYKERDFKQISLAMILKDICKQIPIPYSQNLSERELEEILKNQKFS